MILQGFFHNHQGILSTNPFDIYIVSVQNSHYRYEQICDSNTLSYKPIILRKQLAIDKLFYTFPFCSLNGAHLCFADKIQVFYAYPLNFLLIQSSLNFRYVIYSLIFVTCLVNIHQKLLFSIINKIFLKILIKFKLRSNCLTLTWVPDKLTNP